MSLEIADFPIRSLPLSPAWTAVVLEPFPGLVFVSVLHEGIPVAHVTEADEVAVYLRALDVLSNAPAQ